MFSAKELEEGYSIAQDGLLERWVKLPPPSRSRHVPIVSVGRADAMPTWRRWIFLQCHIGIIGAHRSAEKTLVVLNLQVWWLTMKKGRRRMVELVPDMFALSQGGSEGP